jgi:hypothetical protein
MPPPAAVAPPKLEPVAVAVPTKAASTAPKPASSPKAVVSAAKPVPAKSLPSKPVAVAKTVAAKPVAKAAPKAVASKAVPRKAVATKAAVGKASARAVAKPARQARAAS